MITFAVLSRPNFAMTSGFKINHIFVKILIIIDKYIPLAVTLKNHFIALLYHTHI